MSAVSLSTVSLMAIVPESECRMPTLTVFACARTEEELPMAAMDAARANTLTTERRFIWFSLSYELRDRENATTVPGDFSIKNKTPMESMHRFEALAREHAPQPCSRLGEARLARGEAPAHVAFALG